MASKRSASDQPGDEHSSKRSDTGPAPEGSAAEATVPGNQPVQSYWGIDSTRGGLISLPKYLGTPGRFPYYPVQEPPIADISKVPPQLNWDPNDFDVDDNDLEANIERCQLRIAQGILPQIWRRRLGWYQLEKKRWENETAKLQPFKPGTKDAVLQRLSDLTFVRQSLERRQAFQPQLSNIKSVIRDLSSRAVFLRRGQVAYYCSGHRVAGPKKWDLDEFYQLERNHRDYGGIWVEGLVPGARLYQAQSTVLPRLETGVSKLLAPPWQHMVTFEVRLPGAAQGRKFPMVDDTGADYTLLHMDDIHSLEHLSGVGDVAPEIRLDRTFTSNGSILTTFFMLEVRVMTTDGLEPLTDWVHVPVLAPHTRTEGQARLSGGWWRHMLYVASGPGETGDVKVHSTGPGIRSMIQDIDSSSQSLMDPVVNPRPPTRPSTNPRLARPPVTNPRQERPQSPRRDGPRRERQSPPPPPPRSPSPDLIEL